jgi:tetratricopeptide (TPR) repeat protein
MVFQIRSRIVASGFVNILAVASTITLTVVSSQAQDNRQPPQPMPALTPNGGTGGTNANALDTRAPANVVGRPVVKPVQLLKRAPVAVKSKAAVRTCGQSKASKEVQKMVADGNLAGAIDRWSTEIEGKPNHAEAWIGRAKLRRQIGDNNGAQDDLDRALELSPNNVEALIARASVRRRLTDLRGAGKDIDRAVELAPRSFQALSERSSLRFALNDIQGAMADYNYAMSLNKGGGRQPAQASPAVAQNSSKTATAGNQNSVQANGQSGPSTAHNPQSNNLSSNGKNNASGSNGSNNNSNNTQVSKIPPSKKPLLSAPELARLNNTAVQEINDKHFGAAIKSFERLIEVSPDYAHAKQNLVIAHNNYGLELAVRTPAEAIKHFRAALYLDPTQSAIRKNLASMISEMGKNPESADDRAELADGCLAINDHEGAYVELNEAIRLKNSPQLRMRMMAVLAGITSTDSQSSATSKNAPQVTGEAAAPPAVAAATAIIAPDLIQTEKIESEPDASHMIAAEVVEPNQTAPQTGPRTGQPPAALTGQSTAQSTAQATGQTISTDPLEHYESPSATPAHDLVIDKLTLETSPEMVLQVARQLASENHELDAEGLLMRLCDNLRKKSLKGDRAAEAALENTLETLSHLYVKASRWPNAETSLRELVAIREKTKGQEDPVLGRTLAEYSAILKTLGRHEEAQKQELKANFILNRALSAQ